MTRDETKKILMGIQCSYPNFKPNVPLDFMVDIWMDDLADYSYDQIYTALKTYKATNRSGFAPSVGQLIDQVHSVAEMAAEISESTVWCMVMKAIRNSTYHAEEEFEKLDVIAQEVIGSPTQLALMGRDSEFNESVQKSVFMKTYRQIRERKSIYNRLPNNVKSQIEQLKGMLLEERNSHENNETL